MASSPASPPDPRWTGLPATATLVERLVALGVIAGLFFGVWLVLRPFITAILFGGILVIATWPIRSWLIGRRLSAGLSATILLLALLGIIGIPAAALAPSLGERMAYGMERVQAYFAAAPPLPEWLDYIPFIKERASNIWSNLTAERGRLQESIKPYSAELGTFLVAIARSFGEGVFQLFLALILATMFWLRGDALAKTVTEITVRLGGGVGAAALQSAASAVRGVAYGVVGTAILQAAALTLGLFVAGVPGAPLLGFLALVIAIGQIGILLVIIWGSAAWWLFSTGAPGWGIFMIVWGVLVSTVDNVIRPWLVSFGATMPIALVFLGVFGGFIAFGFLGLFIGPTLLGVSFTLLQAWRQIPEREELVSRSERAD